MEEPDARAIGRPPSAPRFYLISGCQTVEQIAADVCFDFIGARWYEVDMYEYNTSISTYT